MDEFPDNVEKAGSPPTAKQPRRRGPGRPFTPETSRAVQMSATAAKKRRRDTRHRLLQALTTELDLGEELVRALKTRDEQYLGMLLSASKLVGVEYNQSDEARVQNLKVDSNVNAKVDNRLELVFKDEKPGEA